MYRSIQELRGDDCESSGKLHGCTNELQSARLSKLINIFLKEVSRSKSLFLFFFRDLGGHVSMREPSERITASRM